MVKCDGGLYTSLCFSPNAIGLEAIFAYSGLVCSCIFRTSSRLSGLFFTKTLDINFLVLRWADVGKV